MLMRTKEIYIEAIFTQNILSLLSLQTQFHVQLVYSSFTYRSCIQQMNSSGKNQDVGESIIMTMSGLNKEELAKTC